jgi:FMN reductase (NADPH)/FMN reductase [NAD(P)H]
MFVDDYGSLTVVLQKCSYAKIGAMNETLGVILNRKSTRRFLARAVPEEVKADVIGATLRAPTAGNLMLYSIIEVNDQAAKDVLAVSCDHQPFISRAPWVLLFLADYQRWLDYFEFCGTGDFAHRAGLPVRKPAEGDLMLACCDALIAAQTAVIAAESCGLGSCYIGDIMENYETHRDLFKLPRYTFPICLLCLGYPTKAQKARPPTSRFDREFIVFGNSYRRLGESEFKKMFEREQARAFKNSKELDGGVNVGQLVYRRKFTAGFTMEMNRSVKAILKQWEND